MTFQILMSCMHRKDMQIVKDSQINCDVLVVNQCDESREEQSSERCQRMIYTKERGLSKSRNMAIDRAWADICLLSDDDELFQHDVEERVLKAYADYPEADIIAFKVDNADTFGYGVNNSKRIYPNHAYKCGLIGCLHISSWQISFRRASIVEKAIRFDELMGSGTGHGAQEESKFLIDCLRAGLTIWFVPITVATMIDSEESQWFKGFDKIFFIDRGWATRRFLGWWLATLYAFYYAWKKRSMYKQDISPMCALGCMLRGIFLTHYE